MHAANYYNFEGAAALAPALERMMQLTHFNDECTCGDSGGFGLHWSCVGILRVCGLAR